MLTKIRIQNFKQFDDVEIELGPVTVLIGPNNSGKTTILQALMLWNACLLNYLDALNQNNSGTYALNRNDIVSITIPNVQNLWYMGKIVNGVERFITIEVEGQDTEVVGDDDSNVYSDLVAWEQKFDLSFANEESINVFPTGDITQLQSITIIQFLPPMSGLASREDLLQRGAVNLRIGEGQTAEVLRNVCFSLYTEGQHWQKVVDYMRQLFSVEIQSPQYIAGRGELRMFYKDQQGTVFDISAAGRGMLQMLLLLAYMYNNPGSVLLLDEPDAHLEILRQQELYRILSDVARELDSQIIMATHSEVIMNAAGDKDVLIACVGKPHRIDNNNSSQKAQIAKALTELGHDQYFLALQKQWVLYLEGETDLAILQTFSQILNHPASRALERPFAKYIGNVSKHAREHFYALREALESFQGIAILDHPYTAPQSKGTPKKQNISKNDPFNILYWERNEIENYLCQPETLLAYAIAGVPAERHEKRREAMQKAIQDVSTALSVLGKPSPWSKNIKASNEFLIPVFKNFFEYLGEYNVMDKASFYILAPYVPADLIDPEVIEKLDAIWDIAKGAPNT